MPTILLIEDDLAVRRVLRHILLSQGHSVIEAGSAPEAMRASAGCLDPIDLAITDVVMPRTNCNSLIAELKSARPNLKVVLISGYAEDILSQYGIDAGSNFLKKPFTAEQLGAKIQETLGIEKLRCFRQAG